MTYAEIAARLGVSGEAARQVVRRRGWRRIVPNRPGATTIVIVPADELHKRDTRTPDVGDTQTPDGAAAFETALTTIEAAHAAEVAALRAQADTSEQGRLAAQALADAALASIADMGSRLDRADERADRLERDLSGALEVASKAVQTADGLRADLTSTQAELAQQRILTNQARQYASEQEQAAQQALQAGHELRRTDDARKARGRWARLRAAWRGE